MSSQAVESGNPADLRLRALSQLTGRSGPQGVRASASAALAVLHALASAPSTAADALALLHELQVHQVELDLQDEELRNARAELEGALRRQIQLYDFAPSGCFTVDRSTAVHEVNLTGARLLGFERDNLLGRTLDSFFAPHSVRALHAMLTRVSEGNGGAVGALQLAARDGAPRSVQASVSADPAGQCFLVAIVEIGQQDRAQAV